MTLTDKTNFKTWQINKESCGTYHEYKALNTNDKMKDLNILNVFKLKIYQILIFMFRTAERTIHTVFQSWFNQITHSYPNPSRFREGSYDEISFKANQTKFSIY